MTAGLLAFVPVVFVATPAYAAPGDVTISNDLEVAEGDTLTYDVTRAGGSGVPLTLNYSVTGGTATSGVDFQPFSGSTTFAASVNNITKRFNIRGIADTIDEPDETLEITFADADTGLPVVVANGVLVDDDPTPSYALSAPSTVAESVGNAVVTATLSAVSGQDVTIPLTTTAGSATAGQDYTAQTNATIVIPAGQTSGTLNIPILDDSLDESDLQGFTVAAGTDPLVHVTGGNTVTIQITDNEALPVITTSNPGNAVEGSPLTFQATLSAASERTVTVVAASADDTALAGSDYVAVANHTVTFAPGDTSEDIPVTTSLDALDEVNPETLTLDLTSPTNATLGTPATATGAIDDDDNPPTITLAPTTVTEGDSGTATQTFTVTLDAPSGRPIDVGYSTSSGTATAGVDFDNVTAGTLTFAPGDTVKTFGVTIHGDTVDEGASEAFNVVLSNPNNTLGASASLGTTSVTLTDNDATPTLSALPDVTRNEGSGAADFTLGLSNASAQAITLDVAAVDGTAEVDGSGAGSNDYDAPPTTVTFLPGEVSKTISVNVNGDSVFEGDETADVNVTIPGGETDVTGSGVSGTLTLVNDDDAPVVTVSSTSAAEGNNIVVTGTVVGMAQAAIPVDITLAGAADNSGSDPADVADFVNSGPVTVNIPAGDNTGAPVALRTFLASNDNIDEPLETVEVTLTDPAHDIATASAFQSITDNADDLPPTVSVVDETVAETAGTADVDVELTFDANTNDATSTEVPVIVNYTTADGTATAGSDYTAAPPNSSVTIASGDVTGTISVPITDDLAFERNETFTVNVTSVVPTEAAPVVPADGTATVTISENDLGARPTFSVANVTKAENDGTPAVFTVTLGALSTQDVTFSTNMVNGTAVDGGSAAGTNDFDPPATTVTVAANTLSTTISVPVNNDNVYEATETATLEVSLAGGETDAVGGTDSSLLTITDADAAPSVTFTPESSAEGTNIAVSGTVTGVAQDAITVSVSLAGASSGGGDAAEASDFVNSGATSLVIPAGDNSGAPLSIEEFRLNNDTIDEPVETVVATLTDPNHVVANSTGVYRINDDVNDMPPAISLGDPTVTESDATADVDVNFTFAGETTATERPVVVDYTTTDGTAHTGTDYTGTQTGQITIAPGDPGGHISVPIISNNNDGPDRSFTVTITSVSPAEAEITDSTGTVTILDDDADVPRPTFEVAADVTRAEGQGPAVFTVNLSAPTVNDVTFDVSMTDGTAVDTGSGAGSNDYNAPLTTLTIPAGQGSGTISVPINADTVYEQNEDATLNVSLVAGETDATGPLDTATLTITNDDAAPSITLNTQSGTEGTDVVVIATVTGVSQADMTFDLTLSGSSAGGANPAEGVDYDDTGLQATIPAGTTSGQKITLRSIRLEQDTIDEPVESIGVLVEDVDNHVADASSVYRINDDVSDLPPSVSVGDVTADENDGVANVPVSLTFDGETTETERDIVITYRTFNGTALGGSDFTAATAATATIAAGDTEGEIAVPITDDSIDEADQIFVVHVISVTPSEAPIDVANATVTIADADAAPTPTLVAPASRLGSGVIALSGTAGQGVDVQLLAAPVGIGNLVVVASTTTSATGAYSFVRFLSTRGYRFATRAGGVDSLTKTVFVQHEPALTAASTGHGTVTVRVTNDPKLANLTVLVQRLNPNGSWSTVGSGKTNGAGGYVQTLTGLRSRSAYIHRVVILGSADAGLLAGNSAAVRTVVR